MKNPVESLSQRPGSKRWSTLRQGLVSADPQPRPLAPGDAPLLRLA